MTPADSRAVVHTGAALISDSKSFARVSAQVVGDITLRRKILQRNQAHRQPGRRAASSDDLGMLPARVVVIRKDHDPLHAGRDEAAGCGYPSTWFRRRSWSWLAGDGPRVHPRLFPRRRLPQPRSP